MFDVILANPPFSGKVQDESILADLNYKLDTRATELLFLKWFIDHLTPGGRAGVIVPNGVLFGSTNAATALRELLLTECDLQAVISLPSGVFKPYAGVATAALIFQKGKPTQSVWFYDITADGFSLDDKRTPIDANDIPDVLAKWPNREEGPNSYRVPIEKIRENDWSLAAGRYKPVTAEAVNHDAPAEILGDVLKLENEIIRRGNALLDANRRQEMKRWPTKPLGELVLPTEQRDPRQNPDKEFSYVDIAALTTRPRPLSAKKILGNEAPSRARKVIRTGDVTVSTVRPNLNAVALVPASLNNQICSTGVSVLPTRRGCIEWLSFAFTRSPSFIDCLSPELRANYPAVNDGEVQESCPFLCRRWRNRSGS